MTSILALETSGALCSVALDIDGNCFELTRHVERKHNELLLGMIDELCRDRGLKIGELDALAFGCGPGSFTGVRIAAAAVQGMALAVDVPVLPIPSSLVLAHAWVLKQGPGIADILLTSIRSRSQLYYLAAYQVGDGGLKKLQGDLLCDSMLPLPWIDDLSGTVQLVGEPPDWWTGKSAESSCTATAANVAALARERWMLQGGLDAAAALPLYVDGDSPWRRLAAAGGGS